MFVTNYNSYSVSVIPDASNTVVATIRVGTYPVGVAYDSGKGEVFVPNDGSNNVSVISDASNTVVASIPVGAGPEGVAYDSGKGEVFVANWGTNNVSVISDASNTVVATIRVGTSPWGVAYDSGKGEMFVANYNSDNVSVISDATNTVVATIPVGSYPVGVAYDSGKGEVFVANQGSNTVSVIPLNLSVSAAATTANPSGPAWLNVSFTASAWAGSWNYTSWTWSFGDGNSSTLQNPTHTYTKPGTYQANVTVMDSSGAKATSNTVWINVTHPLPFGTTLTPSITTANVSQRAYVNASMTGGVGPFTFKWNATPAYAGCVTSPTSAVATCTPTLPGKTFHLGVEVTDLYGATDNATSPNVTVSSLSALLSASKTSISVGQPVVFNTSTSGDSATLSYDYKAPPAAGCMASTGPSITCTPQKPGWSFSVNVTVTDQYGNTWNATSPVISTGVPTVTVLPSRIAVDVNESMTFATSLTGDLATLSYAYTSPTMAGCALSTSATLTCIPKSNGTFAVSVTATDLYGNSWTATSVTIKVYPALLVNLTISSSTPLLAQTVAFTSNASGGNPPYNYTYLGLPHGCYSENKSSIGCLPTQSDWYNITVIVTDMNNGTAKATVSMHVIFDFNVVIPASSPVGKQLTIMVDTNETFNGSAINKSVLFRPDGGYGTLTYSYSGLPPGCTSADVSVLTCTPTQAGRYSVTVSVHDQAGDHQTHTVLVNIVPSSNNFLGLPGYEGYLLIGAIVVAGVVGTTLLVLKKRRSSPPASKGEASKDKEPEKKEGGKATDETSPEHEKIAMGEGANSKE
nr:PKD domain-containing protein [Ferrimicrobium acidiphilum]